VLDLLNGPDADHKVSLLVKDGLQKVGYAAAGVLVVGVRMNNDVGPKGDRMFEAGCECCGQAPVLWEAEDMVGAGFACGPQRLIGAAVVDD